MVVLIILVRINLEAANILSESKIFLSDKLPVIPWYTASNKTDKLINEDMMFAKGCELVEVYGRPFPEVRSTVNYQPNTRKIFAINHPEKGKEL